MDSSPKSSRRSYTTADSPLPNPVEIQESPIFTYISNLSPIKPVKGAPTPQGFPGLNSPPLVFTSPRISESALCKRPKLSGTGLSGKDATFKEAVTILGESVILNPQSSSLLSPCPQNAHVNYNIPTEKSSNVSAPSDDFLTNAVNMDCGVFTSSGEIHQLVDSLVESEVPEVKFKTQDDAGKDEMITVDSPLIKDKDDKGQDEMVTGASPLMSGQDQEMHQVKPLSDLTLAEADGKLGAGNAQSDACSAVEPNSPIDCALKNAGAGKEAELVCTSQLGSLQNVEVQGNYGEKTMQHDHILEVALQQRGVRRRCLQFEDAQWKTVEQGNSACNLPGTEGSVSSSSCPQVLEVLESSSQDKPSIPGTELFVNVNKPTFSSQNSTNYPMKVPKPSGIGLHLNSIVNAMQIGSGATVSLKSTQRGSLSILGKKSSSSISCHSLKNSSISLNQAEVVSMSSEDFKHDDAASIAPSSTPSLSDMVKHMNDCLLFKPIELQPNQCDKRKSSSENADSIDDSSASSPKKKRKKTLDTDDNNGCKRCNCKKTKCLKLYCDCFAAGIYCADPCACQGCFNRPEYEDTVLETRQQIESRNPLAFAPKIIQHITEPSSCSCVDDGSRYTPASARHKRGCNCKKSKCLKKYCECYQSGVGCCDGCRCEGCENMYGRKGDYSMIKNLVSKHDHDALDGSYDEKLGLAARRGSLPHNELCNPHNLTPLTPSIQYSNHEKTASKSWFSPGLQSPDSGLQFLAPYGTSPGQAMNPDNHGMIPETNNEIMDLVSFDQDLEYSSGDTFSHFAPGLDGPNLPNQQNSANILRTQMLPGNRQVSTASSLRWRSSPISPVTHFGGTKLLEVANFDGRLYGMMNDDTPEVLKETPTPLHAVKVSSPNKKRVSPPHGRGSAVGSSSSAGLRSGRKFILQAVPSFPPLTPCIDSKVHADQNIKDSKDCS